MKLISMLRGGSGSGKGLLCLAGLFVSVLVAGLIAVSMGACKRNSSNDDFEHPGPPFIYVYFVPLDGVSFKDAGKLSEEFAKNFSDKQWEPYYVYTLSHANSPASCLNDKKTRMRADKLRRWLDVAYKDSVLTDIDEKSKMNYEYYVIGITDKDISTPLHGKDDYGILGLSYLGKGNASIISTYRLKRRKDLWKLAVHEFCHGFYGAPHCPDQKCIMADAKGGNPHFETKDSLCSDCAVFCLIGD